MEANNNSAQKQVRMEAQSVNTIMARLLKISTAAVKAENPEKAASTIVNQMHNFIKVDRTVLVALGKRRRVVAVSGNLEASQDNAFSQAVHEVRNYYKTKIQQGDVSAQIIRPETLPEDYHAPNARRTLTAMGGTSIMWVPLPKTDGEASGYALWLERWNGLPWTEEEVKLVSHAAVFFNQALNRPRKKIVKKKTWKRFSLLALVVFFLMMWIPVTSKVNAPAQVTPKNPHYIFAPFDGIIEELIVRPGEEVNKGDLLFRYDTRVLEKQLEEAQQGGLAVARAELARLQGAAYQDEDARARIPVQKLEVEKKEAQVRFLKKQLELAEVRTDKKGFVILDDPDALIGAFIRTGELVMSIADPQKTKLRIMVPVSDAGLLKEGANAVIRLDSDPLKPYPAKITRVGYDVRLSDERMPAVLVEAEWENPVSVTPGQRGICKIEGPEVYLGMQMFRKPIIATRNVLGI